MPESKVQQRAAGMALGYKRQGKLPPGKGAARQMAESMSETQLRDFATTPVGKKLPERKKKKRGKKP